MSYNEIVKLRDLFAQDTLGLVSSNQRLILTMIISHESTDKGCTVGLEQLQKLTHLGKRALLNNLHYLGDGKSWKQGAYTDCTNPKCSQHLGIVKTQHYAKRGWQQVYRTDLRAYELAVRVHVGAPIKLERVHVENLKGAPQYPIECTQVHPYKHEIQERQLQSSYVDLLNKFLKQQLPVEKLFLVNETMTQALLELEHQGISFNAITERLRAVSENSIKNPRGFVQARLVEFVSLCEATSESALPPKCANPDCGEDRRLPYGVHIPNGNGAMSQECPDCNPKAIARNNSALNGSVARDLDNLGEID